MSPPKRYALTYGEQYDRLFKQLATEQHRSWLADLERTLLTERDALRAQLATVTRERDEARKEADVTLGTPTEACAKHGAATVVTTKAGQRWRVACAQCQDDALTTAERERDSWRSQRDEVHAEMERQTQLKREERQAKLDAMRERDEARAAEARLREALQRENMAACKCGDEDYRMSTCPSCRRTAAALASAPSAEPTRDMRVAEAWEAFQPHLDAAEVAIQKLCDREEWDHDSLQAFFTARAVVAKAVGT